VIDQLDLQTQRRLQQHLILQRCRQQQPDRRPGSLQVPVKIQALLQGGDQLNHRPRQHPLKLGHTLVPEDQAGLLIQRLQQRHQGAGRRGRQRVAQAPHLAHLRGQQVLQSAASNRNHLHPGIHHRPLRRDHQRTGGQTRQWMHIQVGLLQWKRPAQIRIERAQVAYGIRRLLAGWPINYPPMGRLPGQRHHQLSINHPVLEQQVAQKIPDSILELRHPIAAGQSRDWGAPNRLQRLPPLHRLSNHQLLR